MAKDTSFALRSLNINKNDLSKTFERLSSGKRINRAQDDAAGLAIAKALEASVATLSQGVRNAADSVSAVNIAESALGRIGEIGTRLKELATQSANGTLSDDQRVALNEEYQQLKSEATRISETTEFNGKKLLANEEINVQVGNDASAGSRITVEGIDAGGLVQSLGTEDILTADGAKTALENVSGFIQQTASARGKLGASQSRIQTAQENNATQILGEEAARSRIMDADIATEVSKNVSANIRTDASTAMVAQSSKLNAGIVQKLLQ